jgi:hypothetical protein
MCWRAKFERNKSLSWAFFVCQVPLGLHQEWWQTSIWAAILAQGLVVGVVAAADGAHKIGVSLEGYSVGAKHHPVLHRLAVGRSLGMLWIF